MATEVITVTPHTASERAGARAELEPNVKTSNMHPAKSNRLMKGI